MKQRLNLFAPEVRENPYPFYAMLRREAPVCQVDPHGMWAISRYDDILAVFKEPRVFSSAGLRVATEPPWLERANPLSSSLIMVDPPHHGRLRALVSRAFTASVLSRMEAYARDVSMRLTEVILMKRQTVDFIPEFALGLPANVLAMVLGLDPELQTHFKRWTDDVASAAAISPDNHARMAQVRRSIDEMERYLRELLESRRRKPGDDLASDLAHLRVDGERLTDEEILSFFCLLLVAGLETTTSLLTHCAMILAQRPDIMSNLRKDSLLIPPFIEEVLRYEPPVHTTIRLCKTETQVGGVRLPAGATVVLLLASGLRDETCFPDPDRFDPQRGTQANLAFGYGIHFCLGAPLARMETRAALDTLLSMCSRIELRTERLQWNTAMNVRSVLSLPVKLVPL
jgi:cytochrome P450